LCQESYPKKDFKRFPTLLKDAAEQYIKEQRGELLPEAAVEEPAPPPPLPQTAPHALPGPDPTLVPPHAK
jgi:hypothetical protein